MRPRTIPIETLLLRTFLPAVVIVAIALAILVYNLLYSTILEGFERKLVTASALTGAMINPQDHDLLIKEAMEGADPDAIENGKVYLRNVEPLRRIRENLGLTYLYSQVIGGPQDVVYVLDSSLDDDHTPIGSPDELPDNTMAGLASVQKQGSIYVSPIQYQEQWGLLKTAAAPISGADGRVAATAGADVNISVIQVATQNALFASAMIGIGSILACVMVAVVLVRRIAKPIEALTDDTLRLAAGNVREASAIPGPREVADLRGSLDSLAGKLAEDARTRESRLRELDAQATGAILRDIAGKDADAPVTLVDASGLRVVWLPAESDKSLLARNAMSRLARRIAADQALAAAWPQLADTASGGCLVIDADDGSLSWTGDEPVTLRIDDANRTLASGGSMRFEPRQTVAIERDNRTPAVVWSEARS